MARAVSATGASWVSAARWGRLRPRPSWLFEVRRVAQETELRVWDATPNAIQQVNETELRCSAKCNKQEGRRRRCRPERKPLYRSSRMPYISFTVASYHSSRMPYIFLRSHAIGKQRQRWMLTAKRSVDGVARNRHERRKSHGARRRRIRRPLLR